MIVKAAGLNPHSGSHWKRLSRRRCRRLMSLNYYIFKCTLSFTFFIFSDSPMASSTSKCRGCLNKANSFCYVCGDFTTVAQRRTITSLLRTAYFHYFDCKISDQDKSWAPHFCCKPCYNGLTAWFNGKKAAFNFAVPMVWREPRNHADDC